MAWEFRREVRTRSVIYDRYQHDVGGAAVVYGGDGRFFDVVVNGQHHDVAWPDTGPIARDDHGTPMAVRIRWDAEWGWTLYAYMFAGDDNPHSEWATQVV